MPLADTPEPPYWAVIFTTLRADAGAEDDYDGTARRMMELASRQPGFLGVEHARDAIGITVSYWANLEAIEAWRRNAEHLAAQRLGRELFYRAFRLRVARVERARAWSRNSSLFVS